MVTASKINCDKSVNLQLSAWKIVSLPKPFTWTYRPLKILSAWFASDFQLEKNWLEVQGKAKAAVHLWSQRRLSLKGRSEVCALTSTRSFFTGSQYFNSCTLK